jgi:hypothetical protein
VIVEVSTVLGISAEKAWTEVRKSKLLKYVAYPLLTFQPLNPTELPAIWRPGKYLVRLKALGCIPLGKQWIVISQPGEESHASPEVYRIRDNGFGDLVSKWDHLITIRNTPDGLAHYTDTVEVRAGLLTPFVWLYSQIFYRHRQRRLRKLVKNDFHYGR